MITCRDYNQEKLLDRVWYESSNILYSECDDNVDALKTLRVTFKNGATYEYSDVDVNDYVMFIAGGREGSNGKALNKHIKPNYECRRIEDRDLTALSEEKERILKEQANPHNVVWRELKNLFTFHIPGYMKTVEDNGKEMTQEDVSELFGYLSEYIGKLSETYACMKIEVNCIG